MTMATLGWRLAKSSIRAESVRRALGRLREVELEDLEPRNAGGWPAPVRGVAMACVFVLVLGAAWALALAPKAAALSARDDVEQQLKDAFRRTSAAAAPLATLRADGDALRTEFAAVLDTLPTGTEVPGLLEDIARAALVNDLAVQRIDLGAESPAELYVELPIEIVLSGRYHQIGGFTNAVANLARLVTLHDFEIARAEDAGELRFAVVAKTYRRRAP